MHAYHSLGFALGDELSVSTQLSPQAAYALPTSRWTGQRVIPVGTKEVDAQTGVVRDMATGQVTSGGGFPWLWVAGGLAAVGAFMVFKKKRGGSMAGLRRRRR